MSNLLAIDFDNFFPNPMEAGEHRADVLLFDWGHREAPIFMEAIGPSRAEGFLMNGLPLPDLDGREVGFWDRFRFTRGARLFYADSNACAASPKVTGRGRHWESVWLYDAHHDSGYSVRDEPGVLVDKGMWACENWMILYRALGAKLHMRYPPWRANGNEMEPEPRVPVDRAVDVGDAPPVVFDRVFVCRSSAWVPPWHDIDRRFEEFIASAPLPANRKLDVDPYGVRRRDYDPEDVARDAALHKQMMRDIHVKTE